MPIRYERTITPALCREHPDALLVFGDNWQGVGKGGQAIIRDEPNAIGIATKRRPSMDESAFFTDDDLTVFIETETSAFDEIAQHLRKGGTVIWPADGIGTGRAQLETRAPRVWACLQRAITRLKEIESA